MSADINSASSSFTFSAAGAALLCNLLYLFGIKQRGQIFGHSVHRVRVGRIFLFFLFGFVPEIQRLLRIIRVVRAENVSVSVEKFAAKRGEHIAVAEIAFVARYLRVEHRLHKHVAALFQHSFAVRTVNGVHKLVRFLNEIDAYALVRLRSVPFAAAFAAQSAHNLLQVRKIEALAFGQGDAVYPHRVALFGKRAKLVYAEFLSAVQRFRPFLPAVKRGKFFRDRLAVCRVQSAHRERHALVDRDVFGQYYDLIVEYLSSGEELPEDLRIIIEAYFNILK